MVIEKSVVPYKKTPISQSDSWDAGAAEKSLKDWATTGEGEDAKIDFGKYKQGFAWYDGSKEDDLGSYKLPHHQVEDGELKLNKKGVMAAMAALNGARGGTKIDDREGVYNHLKKHYLDLGIKEEDIPELKSAQEYENALAKEAEESTEELEKDAEDGDGADIEEADNDIEVAEDGTHAAFTGTHTHKHPAYGSDEDGEAHEHEHTHNNDANHDHDHNADAGGDDDESEDKSLKVDEKRAVKSVNDYIWINRSEKPFLLTDSDITRADYDSEKGICYFYKSDPSNILMWRFDKSYGWSDEAARIFTYSMTSNIDDLQKALEKVQTARGHKVLAKSVREAIYGNIARSYDNLGLSIPPLTSQSIYKTKAYMEDKMKKLAELSNEDMQNFLKEAQEVRLDITKSATGEKKAEPMFKVFGNVEAYIVKTIRKNDDGTETEEAHNRLRTTFTSNKADLANDITSKGGIVNAIDRVQKRGVIPIRFEHQPEDYGVWDTFKTFEKDGVLYGQAEGELDMSLARSQDLWKEIYQYGKKFATSYGGHWNQLSFMEDADGNFLRVFEDLDFDEISLTNRPCNPDTAVEAMNKAFEKFAAGIDDTKLNKALLNSKIAKDEETSAGAPVSPESQATDEAAAPENAETSAEAEVKPEEKGIVAEIKELITPLAERIESLEAKLAGEAKEVAEEVTEEVSEVTQEAAPEAPEAPEAPAEEEKPLEVKSYGRKTMLLSKNSMLKAAILDEITETRDEEALKELEKNHPYTANLVKGMATSSKLVF